MRKLNFLYQILIQFLFIIYKLLYVKKKYYGLKNSIEEKSNLLYREYISLLP